MHDCDIPPGWTGRLGVVVLALILLSMPIRLAAAEPPGVLLARSAAADVDPAAYWVSEKLDGVRAVWDGRVLRFRSGRVVNAPRWFLDGLPPQQALDGELWGGRGAFDRVSSVVRRERADEREWQSLRYMVFELPGADGDFSARVAEIRRIVAAQGVPWLGAVEQRRLADRRALVRLLADTVAAGGEGLMLHRADAPYLTGRSDALLKLKPWEDAEARVVGHVPGRGRHRGRLGALLVEDSQGRRFRLGGGFSDAQRDEPPAIGSIVTYRYHGLSSGGLPRFARFWRLRADAELQAMPGSSGEGASSRSR